MILRDALTKKPYLVIVYGVILGSHLVAFLQARFQISSAEIGLAWSVETEVLIVVLAGVSILFANLRAGFARLGVGLVYAALLFMAGYPLGGYLGLELTLFVPFLFGMCLMLARPFHAIIASVALAANILAQGEVDIGTQMLDAPTMHDTLSFGFFGTVMLLAFLGIRELLERSARATNEKRRLENAVQQLSSANLGFQQYASTVREESYKAERDRITRDLHDSIGYSLTNLIMMLEAAKDLPVHNPDGVLPAIERAKSYAEITLHDVRLSLRAIRSIWEERPDPLQAVQRLVTNFAEATGVHVETQYGNVDLSRIPLEVFSVVYRVLQESLTNSFRHGHADQIWIYMWWTDGTLRCYVRDDGQGSSTASAGIGLQGMRERVSSVSGTLAASNMVTGFEVTVEIPLAPDGSSDAREVP